MKKFILISVLSVNLSFNVAQAISCPEVPAGAKNNDVILGSGDLQWRLSLSQIKSKVPSTVLWLPSDSADTNNQFSYEIRAYANPKPVCILKKPDQKITMELELELTDPSKKFSCEQLSNSPSLRVLCKTNSFNIVK